MFKMTCFAPIEPRQLAEKLKGILFKTVKNGFERNLDGTTFRIEPFQNQPRDSMKAYRVYFEGSVLGGSYLFDLSLGCMGAIVTGVEYILEHPSMKQADWLKELRRRPSYQMTDSKCLFKKHDCGVIVVNNTVTLQLRSKKNQKLIMVDCLKKIDFIREDLLPVEFDLFSFSEEEEIA